MITQILGRKGIEKLLHDAEVNHCLSFEQVSDEMIEQYEIPSGEFDTISECKYTLPGFHLTALVGWDAPVLRNSLH